jgi:hypothetical protein
MAQASRSYERIHTASSAPNGRRCPDLKNGRISEVGALAPTKKNIGEGVLTPEASGAEAQIQKTLHVRAKARTSDFQKLPNQEGALKNSGDAINEEPWPIG